MHFAPAVLMLRSYGTSHFAPAGLKLRSRKREAFSHAPVFQTIAPYGTSHPAGKSHFAFFAASREATYKDNNKVSREEREAAKPGR